MKQKFKELKVNDRVKTLHSGMATVVKVYNEGTMVKLDCDVKKWNCPYFYEHELDFGDQDVDEQDVHQETLEKVAEVYANKKGDIPTTKLEDAIFKQGFIDGAKWQQEIMYSEEDIKNAFLNGWELRDGDLPFPKAKKKWFKEFKNK
jgi:hypothetical protein